MENFFLFWDKIKNQSCKKTKRKSKKTQKKWWKKNQTHLILIKLARGSCQGGGMAQLCCSRNLHEIRLGWILCGSSGSAQIRRSIDIRLWHTFLGQFNIQDQVFFCLFFFSDHTTNQKHIKKRVKSKLVSKNLSKKIQKKIIFVSRKV